MNKLSFPENFLWGGATAAEQSEGNVSGQKGQTIWDTFYKEKQERFHESIGPAITSNFATHYKNDLKLFASIGANSVRLSFSWARLFPNGPSQVSQKGIKFYHDILDEAKKNNLKIVMTLFHFDMPLWAQDKGGWESSEVIQHFTDYAEIIFSEYGDKVHMYATMNEPIIPILGGYLFKFHWPLVEDEKRAFQASYGTILAHAKVVNLFNAKFKTQLKAQIGVVINVAQTYPKDGINYSKEDKKAAYMNDVFHNHAFLKPMLKGEFPKELMSFLKENPELMPSFKKEELEEIKKVKVDYVGVNFYGPNRVQSPKPDYKSKYKFQQYSQGYSWKQAVMNVFRGWEIYPKAIYDISMLLKEEYGNLPFYISENGMGVQDEGKYRNKQTGMIEDDYRIAFLNEHLWWCHKAIQNGAPLFGYHMWAIFDCWSWLNSYKNRYGFIEIDLETQKRIPKKSAFWLKETAKENAINAVFTPVQEVMDLTKVKFEKSV